MKLKRAILSAFIVVGMLSFGFWTGRSSSAYSVSDSQLFDEMNQAIQQASQEKELILLREMLRREMAARIAAEPVHRYGGRPCVAAD